MRNTWNVLFMTIEPDLVVKLETCLQRGSQGIVIGSVIGRNAKKLRFEIELSEEIIDVRRQMVTGVAPLKQVEAEKNLMNAKLWINPVRRDG